MYAIVKTGGKQYKVAEGDVIEVEKLAGAPGDAVSLSAVLLVDGDDLVTDAAVLAQILWGYLFCLPVGFSFTALRMSTALLGLGAVLSTYALCREAGASHGIAFLCALAVAANPLIFQSSNTFMSDTPFLAFFLMSFLCFAHSARTSSLRTAALAIVLALAATMTRQVGMALPVLFVVGCLLSRLLTIRNAVLAAITYLVLHGAMRLFGHWLAATGQLSANYGRLMHTIMERLRHPFAT